MNLSKSNAWLVRMIVLVLAALISITVSVSQAQGAMPLATETLNVTVPSASVKNNEYCVAGPGCLTSSLRAGDQVTINSISGSVNFDKYQSMPTCIYVVNANGLDRAIYEDPSNQVICGYEGDFQTTDPLPSSGHAGLYRMLNTARTFIGTGGANFTASGSQTLYLGVNDGNGTNNLGSFQATVTIVRTSTHVVTNTNDSGDGSLRQAILDANVNAGFDYITFNISGSGVKTISPASALPVITDPILLNGYSQPGSSANTLATGDNANILIQLDGSNPGAGPHGLEIDAGGEGSTIKGLAITHFSSNGIYMTAGNNIIAGNFIGINPAGTVAQGNNVGIFIANAANNQIGTSNVADRNIVSGNNVDGIHIDSAGATGNLVKNNYIGTDKNGTASLGNSYNGVVIISASNNTIGGTTAVERNIISGNGRNGLGINLSGATSNLVQGNFIGTNVTGDADLGNGRDGVIVLNGANTIGSAAAGGYNVISGNGWHGVEISGTQTTGNVVQTNLIGTNLAGTTAIPNSLDGVHIENSANNTIGGTTATLRNIVAFNTGNGVEITSGTGNSIKANSIYTNGSLGIDLGNNGVSSNDSGDGDTGANNLQNYPVLASAVNSPTATVVNGTLNSAANTMYRVEFFSSASCDGSGYGEGQTYQNFQNVATNGSGNGTISITLSPQIPLGQYVTAVAIDPNGNTSEFSQCRQVTLQADLAVTKTDSPDPVTAGQNINYTIVVTNTGPSNATSVTLTDAVPTNTTFISLASPAGFSCSTPAVGSTGTISCSNASMAANASGAFTLVVKVNANAANGASISNTANVSSSTTDPDSTDNAATATTTVNTRADLAVSKTDSPDPVAAGQNINYTIIVTNTGPSNATNVTLTDAVPTNTTFVSLASPAGFSCSTPAVGGTGTISCSNASMAANASGTFTLVVKVSASTANGATISNTANVSSGTTDPDATDNAATTTTTVNTRADVSISQTEFPDPVVAGQNLTYTIIVTNTGPSNAASVTITDTVPTNTTFVSLNNPVGFSCSTPSVGSTGMVSCSNANVTVGTSGTFTFVVKVGAGTPNGTTISNSVYVSSGTTDPTPANNSATATTTVNPSADLVISKRETPELVIAGQNIAYTIIVTNTGPSNAASVTMTDTVPTNTKFVSLSGGTGFSCTTPSVGGTGIISCGDASMNVGASATFVLTVQVDANTANGASISNTARVISSTGDPDTTDNLASTTTTVNTRADLVISKTDSPDPVTAGQNLTYTIIVTNTGSSNAASVVMTNIVPATTTFFSLNNPVGFSCTTPSVGGTGTISCSNASMAANASGIFTLVVKVNAGTANGTSISNTAYVSSSTTDSNPGNNLANTTTLIVASTNYRLFLPLVIR